MGRILQMSAPTNNHHLSGGHLFSGIEPLVENLTNIYVAALAANEDETVTITCDFNFLDVRVKKVIARFFRAYSKLHERTNRCSFRVIWTYDYQDDDMEEFGEILEELTDIPFEYVQVDMEEIKTYAKAN